MCCHPECTHLYLSLTAGFRGHPASDPVGVLAASTPGGGQAHFGASAAPVIGHVTYVAIAALVLNLAVSAVLTVLFRKVGLQDGYDETRPADYFADPGDRAARHGRDQDPSLFRDPVAPSLDTFRPAWWRVGGFCL